MAAAQSTIIVWTNDDAAVVSKAKPRTGRLPRGWSEMMGVGSSN